MNTSMMNQYKYLAKDGDGALAFHGSVPCYLPNKSNGCYESENGSLIFYGKCVQNGTPSPSSPVAVEYVDGDGRIGVQQLVQNGNFVDTSGWNAHNPSWISYSVANNKITVTARYSGYSGDDCAIKTELIRNTIAGRIYLVLANYRVVQSQKTIYPTTEISRHTVEMQLISGTLYGIFATADKSHAYFYVKSGGNKTIGDIWEYSNVQAFDLTAMYGAGNEPSTVEQFKQMYPNDYYACMYGTTLTMPDLYGIGDIRDTYEPCVWVNGALRSRLTRRIGVVDLGTLSWSYNGEVFTADVTGKKHAISEGLICSLYTPTVVSTSDMANMNMRGYLVSSFVAVKNTSYSDAAAFKAAMSGVMLYYELANPVITLGDPQPVQSYGGATNIFHTSVVQPKIAATVVTHS